MSIQIDVLLSQTADNTHANGVFVASNVNIGGCWTQYANGVYLWVFADTHRAKLTGNHSQCNYNTTTTTTAAAITTTTTTTAFTSSQCIAKHQGKLSLSSL